METHYICINNGVEDVSVLKRNFEGKHRCGLHVTALSCAMRCLKLLLVKNSFSLYATSLIPGCSG